VNIIIILFSVYQDVR